MLRRIISVVLVTLSWIPSLAQGKVVTASGTVSIINKDVEKAKKEAFLEAEKNAVEQAYGFEITSLKLLEEGEKKSYQQFIASTSYANVNALSVEYAVAKKTVTATITANVVKEEHDSFISVENLKQRYRPSEPIGFRVKTYKDGYLYIFYLGEDGKGEQLYPVRWETNYITKYSVLDMSLIRMEKYEVYGVSRLFVVLLDEEHPFKDCDVTEKALMRWYGKIPQAHKNTGVWSVFGTTPIWKTNEMYHPRVTVVSE